MFKRIIYELSVPIRALRGHARIHTHIHTHPSY